MRSGRLMLLRRYAVMERYILDMTTAANGRVVEVGKPLYIESGIY